MADSSTEVARCLEEAQSTYSRWLEEACMKRSAERPRQPMNMPLVGWLGQQLAQEACWYGKMISKKLAIYRKTLKRHDCLRLLTDEDLWSIHWDLARLLATGISAFQKHIEDSSHADGNIGRLAVNALRKRTKMRFDLEFGRITLGVSELRTKAMNAAISAPSAFGTPTKQSRRSVRSKNEGAPVELIARLEAHIQRAKENGVGFKSKAAFYGQLKINSSDYYRWERGEFDKIPPSYKERIEARIRTLRL